MADKCTFIFRKHSAPLDLFHIHRIAVGILAIAGCLPASLRLLHTQVRICADKVKINKPCSALLCSF